uniref:Uncharacterized protein n=1 Tax=Oryza sativa subsp. japonica TaxID=39947 RepID=Q6EQJ4_ORYSJ|nr:hypothetical protein [Oryza sativa Japonica Group]BAD29076.1 hypothetical protein [Oryza sativa Japonica Group]
MGGAVTGGAVAGVLTGRGRRPPRSLVLDMNSRGINVEAAEEGRSKRPWVVVGEDGRVGCSPSSSRRSGGGGRPRAEWKGGRDHAKDAVRTFDARGAAIIASQAAAYFSTEF